MSNSQGRGIDAVRFGPAEATSIFLGFVHPGEVRTPFMMSVIRLMMAVKHRVTVAPSLSGPNISQPRNELVEAFLQTENEWLLMVDTDIEFTPEDVDRLLSRDKDIVGGNYRSRFEIGADPLPVASVHLGNGTHGRATPDNLGTDSGCVQVSGLGMGFTIVRRRVLEELGSGPLWPFAEVVVLGDQVGAETDEAKEQPHLISEDITFCYRASRKGYDCWLDLDTRLLHHKMTAYGPEPARQLVGANGGESMWNS